MSEREPSPGAVTALLVAWRAGDASALDRLVPLVYAELKRIARRRLRDTGPGETLQPTSLVHEAFIRLVAGQVDWRNRAHFFAVASSTMRNISVDHYRRRSSRKRGGDAVRVELTGEPASGAAPDPVDLLALDEALTRLERLDSRQAKVVELRYLTGLTDDETAEVLGCSPITVQRDWRSARAWLFRQLESTS